MPKTSKLSANERRDLLEKLRDRFHKHMDRHRGIEWGEVEARLEGNPDTVKSLAEMERTGGEPDVVGHHEGSGQYVFCDCSVQSPSDRRSCCYDREARVARKKHPPKSSAMEMAQAMGAELLTEEEYRALQELGAFDTKTSSWLLTPADIRDLGGAIFGDRRFDTVFTYHNGADSYYAARGFRCSVRI